MRCLYMEATAGLTVEGLLGAMLQAGLQPDALSQAISDADLPLFSWRIDESRTEDGRSVAAYLLPADPDVQYSLSQAISMSGKLPVCTQQRAAPLLTCWKRAAFSVYGESDALTAKLWPAAAVLGIWAVLLGLDLLDIKQVYVSRLGIGKGEKRLIPAPITAELLHDWLVLEQEAVDQELTSFAGALLAVGVAEQVLQRPHAFVSKRIGYGGVHESRPWGCLRISIGEIIDEEELVLEVIEANLTEVNPPFYDYVLQKLLAAGAEDVWVMPITVKRGRPAVVLNVLAETKLRQRLTSIIFQETSCQGCRYHPVQQEWLEKERLLIDSRWGEIQVTVSRFQKRICQIVPDYEECRQMAEKEQVPLKTVWQDVLTVAYRRLSDI